MKLARHLLPKNKATRRPVLWHSDLHTDNIFVDPEEPAKITGVVDGKLCTSPLYSSKSTVQPSLTLTVLFQKDSTPLNWQKILTN